MTIKKRNAELKRKTRETDISVKVNIDGVGKSKINTGIGFLDHMLCLFAKHGFFDLTVKAKGDLNIDLHHTNEDLGIVLGCLFDKALGDKKGIIRFGHAYVPMDDTMVRVVVDISGRPYFSIRTQPYGKIIAPIEDTAGYSLKYTKDFLDKFAANSKITLHIDILETNGDFHHVCEAIFKALGIALDKAACRTSRRKSIPSTKGSI